MSMKKKFLIYMLIQLVLLIIYFLAGAPIIK